MVNPAIMSLESSPFFKEGLVGGYHFVFHHESNTSLCFCDNQLYTFSANEVDNSIGDVDIWPVYLRYKTINTQVTTAVMR